MRGILAAERRKAAKDARKLIRGSNLAMHIGSVALAIEALEALLVEKGILGDDELMQKIKSLSVNYSNRGLDMPVEKKIPSGDD